MATSGIRKGKARFGDDVRERARKFFEEQKKGKTDKGAKPVTKATAPKPTATKTAAKAAAKPAAKPAATPARKASATDSAKRMQAERSRMSDRTSREPSRPISASRKTASQMGPRTTFPRNVGTQDSKAAAARKDMMDKQGPLGDLMDKLKGSKGTGGQMSRGMKKGGKVKRNCK